VQTLKNIYSSGISKQLRQAVFKVYVPHLRGFDVAFAGFSLIASGWAVTGEFLILPCGPELYRGREAVALHGDS
jgi:hypothetical protein